MANPLLWLLNHSGTVLDAQLEDDSLLQALGSNIFLLTRRDECGMQLRKAQLSGLGCSVSC